MHSRTPLGKIGENIAAGYLQKNGYRIIERNYYKRAGEIDIIAIDKDTLVFVEVKTRNSVDFGSPLEAITPWKLRSLIKTAQYYKMTHRNVPDLLRIDAVSINISSSGEVDEIQLVKNITDL